MSLPFSAPALSDAPRVFAAAALAGAQTNDLSFANIYLLQGKYQTAIAFYQDCLLRHFAGNGRLRGYAFPAGRQEQVHDALDAIESDAHDTGRPLHFCALTQEQLDILLQRYGDSFCWTEDRGDADYLYLRKRLAELPGSAYHQKRNHIARFEKEHPSWQFSLLSQDNAEDALHVARAWLESQNEKSPALLHEGKAIDHALQHRTELGLTGGLIYVEGKPVAMSLASSITRDVADIHYEKCHPDFRDAYPVINRELARRLSSPYVNREEDLNIPGLRKAKLSYHPYKIIPRFSGTVC